MYQTHDWEARALAMADRTVHPASRWHSPLAQVPRHLLVPNWWQYGADGWTRQHGADDAEAWMEAAYSGVRTLVTQVGGVHADTVGAADRAEGLPTSSSTLPALIVMMYQHAMITDGADVLVTCGSGYGTALLAQRLAPSGGSVTSVDVDPQLVGAARHRLAALGVFDGGPSLRLVAGDLTGDLPAPGRWDRIVATVSVPGVPTGWLAALPVGGRLVTTLAGTGLLIAADRTGDGGASGRVVGRAGFMAARASAGNYPPSLRTCDAWEGEGEEVRAGRYPVVPVEDTWDLRSMLALEVPGIVHDYDEDADGIRTAVMVGPDGSWARAVGRYGETPTVHQSGPRRLWDVADAIRHDAVSAGTTMPVEGAAVSIDPTGEITLTRGSWKARVPAAPAPVPRRFEVGRS